MRRIRMTSSPPKPRRRRYRIVLGALAVLLVAGGAFAAVVRPSNDRDWSEDQARLPEAVFTGRRVLVHNVRDFDYQATDRWTPRWEDRSYDLDSLSSVWFAVEPFSDVRGPAHTFVTFGFGDSLAAARYVGISVEIRKEKGEHFSPMKGILRQYELTYVVGDERDLVRLRSNFRRDSVFLYRVHTTPEKARALFVSMLERANRLKAHPEFYNTLTNTCTTNIVRHVNELVPGRVPFSYKVLLPAYADELAYDLGLLGHDQPFDSLRAHALINDRALAADHDSLFSQRIRE